MMFSFDFVSIRQADGERVVSHATVDDAIDLEPPLHGCEARVSLSGPIEWSMNIKGAHAFQALEVALFTIRTMLATTPGWAYEDEHGRPLDFSYSWSAKR